jgi:hypothetical protein
MIEMATMTDSTSTAHGSTTPYGYWLSFVTEWDRLSTEARFAGQDEMADFFGELADDAADVWAGFYGPLGR